MSSLEPDDPQLGPGEIHFHESDRELVKSIENEALYVGRRLVTDTRVPGNINKPEYREFWTTKLKPYSTELLIETIARGYSLPFREVPPSSFEGNNKSAREDSQFVRAEVLRLESLGCISRVKEKPHLVLPLSSVFSKKKRLVVDASRALNPFLLDRKVRLQDLRDIPNILKPGMVQAVDDLDSGYWHLKIAPEHRTYLGISIEDEKSGKPIFFVWNTLFLGIKDAVYIFTLILRPVRAYLTSLGVPYLMYLDDAWMAGEDHEDCLKNRATSREVLKKAGFVVSESKAIDPNFKIIFLGLEVCSLTMKFYIPEKKIQKIIVSAGVMLRQRRVQLRKLASFVGFVQSCSKALGPVSRLMLRACYNWMSEVLNVCPSYNIFYFIPDSVREELEFWRSQIRSLSGYPISPSQSLTETRITVVTDSSQDGAFGYQLEDNYKVLLRRSFSLEERKESSTMRELLALKFIYSSELANLWTGLRILHLTDNKGVSSIVERGSKKKHLQEVVVEIFQNCRRKNIQLFVEWRPRSGPLLVLADLGSKSFDSSSFSLDFSGFSQLIDFFGINFDVDCCAELWNRKAPIYFSKIPDPFSSGVNFFAQNLNGDLFHYIFPPAGLIVPSLMHLSHFKICGVIIVPVWPATSFWLSIVPDGCHFAGWVVKWLRFRPGIVSDINIRSMTFKNPLTFDLLALQFNFKGDTEIFKPNVSPRFCLRQGCDVCSRELTI